MPELTLLAIDDPLAPYLKLLAQLPDGVRIIVGREAEFFESGIGEADVVFAGLNTAGLVRQLWPRAGRLRWIHSLAAGVEGFLFPELVESPIPLTNARGVFRRSLAEFALAAALHFAKDLRRMTRSQQAGVWDSFDVEELHGKTMGIAGYGEIGRAVAELARAFGMRVLALRRRPELCGADPLVDAAFRPDQRVEMIAQCDYLAVSSALTPQTRGLVGAAEIAAMKPGAVLINVGRGPVVDEAALVEALRAGRIRGAALDVFNTEPLPAGHPFYSLENVLLSAHCADHTPGWLEMAMQCFIGNFHRFTRGEALDNVVDKRQGY
ncbi:MAG: D-2-hydroxyacid dehydrogenase [Acidobacteria bacterium]|nr:D-2-hydroxyacid dehydrogenase [Acidobacteriota bacterium]